MTTVRITYTAGRFGIDDQGSVRFLFRFASDAGRPQFDRPGAPNFCSVTASNGTTLPPEYHPVHAAIHTLTHTLPPNLLNPFNFNPLRSVLERVIDFERLNHSPDAPQLYLNATNVRTGKLRYFDSAEEPITADHVIASGSLPPGFPATRIGEDFYWDGGLRGTWVAAHPAFRRAVRDTGRIAAFPATRMD